MKHEWICPECATRTLFRQPELPQADYKSEQNEERTCTHCNTEMYFDEEGAEL